MTCAICGERIVATVNPAPREPWFTHPHSGDAYCGTGDGAMAEPRTER